MLLPINNFKKYCEENYYWLSDDALSCVDQLIGLGFKPSFQDRTVTWPLFVNEFYDDTGIIAQVPVIDTANTKSNQLIDRVTETYDITFIHDYDEFTEHYNVAKCMGENMKKPEMETLEHFKTKDEFLAYIKE